MATKLPFRMTNGVNKHRLRAKKSNVLDLLNDDCISLIHASAKIILKVGFGYWQSGFNMCLMGMMKLVAWVELLIYFGNVT
jgi:hypothetical protein